MGHIKRGIFRTARGITYKELVEGIKENILNPDLNNFLLTEEWINALTQMDVKCEIK